jgi:hypothetical protein
VNLVDGSMLDGKFVGGHFEKGTVRFGNGDLYEGRLLAGVAHGKGMHTPRYNYTCNVNTHSHTHTLTLTRTCRHDDVRLRRRVPGSLQGGSLPRSRGADVRERHTMGWHLGEGTA